MEQESLGRHPWSQCGIGSGSRWAGLLEEMLRTVTGPEKYWWVLDISAPVVWFRAWSLGILGQVPFREWWVFRRIHRPKGLHKVRVPWDFCLQRWEGCRRSGCGGWISCDWKEVVWRWWIKFVHWWGQPWGIRLATVGYPLYCLCIDGHTFVPMRKSACSVPIWWDLERPWWWFFWWRWVDGKYDPWWCHLGCWIFPGRPRRLHCLKRSCLDEESPKAWTRIQQIYLDRCWWRSPQGLDWPRLNRRRQAPISKWTGVYIHLRLQSDLDRQQGWAGKSDERGYWA